MLTGAAAAAAGGLRHGNLHGEHRADLRHARDYPLRYRQGEGLSVQVLQAGSVTKGLKGQELTDFDALLEAGAPCLTVTASI